MSRAAGALRFGIVGTVFTVAVVVLMMWLAGVFHDKVGPKAAAAAPRPAGALPVAAVREITVPRVESAVGTVRAAHEVAVASKLLAKVISVHVVAGQAVSKGDVLVELDKADLEARVNQAAAALEAAEAAERQAKIEYDRTVGLYETSAAAKIELERADTALKSARAERKRAAQALSEAKTILSYATIHSPIDGVVIDKQVEAGDTVTPGQTVVTLYDPKQMQLVARVRESLTRRLKVGQSLAVQIGALQHACLGRISEIVPEAESTSRTFEVKVTGPCPPGVYTGMFGRLEIPLDDERVLVVPERAIRRVGQLDVVDVVEDGVLHRRVIQRGRSFGTDVEVLAGLRAGEQVVLHEAPATQRVETPAAGATAPRAQER